MVSAESDTAKLEHDFMRSRTEGKAEACGGEEGTLDMSNTTDEGDSVVKVRPKTPKRIHTAYQMRKPLVLVDGESNEGP